MLLLLLLHVGRVTTVLVLMSIDPPESISRAQMAVPVILICCREVTMSALREWAASAGGAAHKVGQQAPAVVRTSMRRLSRAATSEQGFQAASPDLNLMASNPLCSGTCLPRPPWWASCKHSASSVNT